MEENNTNIIFIGTQKVEFVNMKKEHIKHVALLENQCFGEKEAWSYNSLMGELSQKYKHYFVGILGKEIISYGGYAQILDEAHIMNIATNFLYRKKGLANKILDLIFADAKSRGIKRITLEVKEKNFDAKKLYEKRGFVCEGVRKKYYHNTDDALIYWKEM